MTESGKRPASVGRLDPADRMLLEIGPAPRAGVLTVDELARLRVLWAAHRDELLAATPPGQRPWAARFDEPGA